jgi:hypothetical protein
MRSTIRARSKNKVGSLRSMKQWFAFRSLTHYALKQYERATHSRFPFTNVMGRVRECLTLMPGQSANADCRRAPGRHLWFTDVILGGPFATRAHASNVAGNRMVFVHSNRSGWRMIDARVRQPNLVANAPRPDRFVRSPAGISRASLPQAQHRLSRLLLICRRAATSRKTKAKLVEMNLRAVHG